MVELYWINRFPSLCKNLFNLLEFLLQHIIVQDQDGQNNNMVDLLLTLEDWDGKSLSVKIKNINIYKIIISKYVCESDYLIDVYARILLINLYK